jgi:hypothetical protein
MKVYENTPYVAFSAISGSFVSRDRQAAMAAFPPTSDATARSRPSFKRVEMGAPAAAAPDAVIEVGVRSFGWFGNRILTTIGRKESHSMWHKELKQKIEGLKPEDYKYVQGGTALIHVSVSEDLAMALLKTWRHFTTSTNSRSFCGLERRRIIFECIGRRGDDWIASFSIAPKPFALGERGIFREEDFNLLTYGLG